MTFLELVRGVLERRRRCIVPACPRPRCGSRSRMCADHQAWLDVEVERTKARIRRDRELERREIGGAA